MDEIIEKLTQVPCPLRMIIIVALPGMGKTQVAIRVSHDLLLSYKKTVIFIEKQENLTDGCLLRDPFWFKRTTLLGKTVSCIDSQT